MHLLALPRAGVRTQLTSYLNPFCSSAARLEQTDAVRAKLESFPLKEWFPLKEALQLVPCKLAAALEHSLPSLLYRAARESNRIRLASYGSRSEELI